MLVCAALSVCRLIASGVSLGAREKAAARDGLTKAQRTLNTQGKMPKYLVEPLAQAIASASS